MNLLENIVFWILILSIIGICLWLAFGSPEFETSAIAIGIFVAGSEILLWRTLFSIDKRTAIGFEKVRSEFKEVNNRLSNIEKNINEIKDNLLNKRKR